MRKIKFRGKRVDNGEWVEGDLIQLDGQVCIAASDMWGTEFSRGTIQLQVAEVIPETVGQLWAKGKNLTVYTDDLLMAECSIDGGKTKRMLCKVMFDGAGMDVTVWHKNEWYAYSCMNYTTAEVVGNIHDNPELLKQ